MHEKTLRPMCFFGMIYKIKYYDFEIHPAICDCRMEYL